MLLIGRHPAVVCVGHGVVRRREYDFVEAAIAECLVAIAAHAGAFGRVAVGSRVAVVARRAVLVGGRGTVLRNDVGGGASVVRGGIARNLDIDYGYVGRAPTIQRDIGIPGAIGAGFVAVGADRTIGRTAVSNRVDACIDAGRAVIDGRVGRVDRARSPAAHRGTEHAVGRPGMDSPHRPAPPSASGALFPRLRYRNGAKLLDYGSNCSGFRNHARPQESAGIAQGAEPPGFFAASGRRRRLVDDGTDVEQPSCKKTLVPRCDS